MGDQNEREEEGNLYTLQVCFSQEADLNESIEAIQKRSDESFSIAKITRSEAGSSQQ